MEMWHWRAVMVAILALIVSIASLSLGGEGKSSRLSIVSASSQQSEKYLIFFNHFAAAIIKWREIEPEAAIRDQWLVLVSQDSPDEDENPPIIVAVVNSNGGEGKVVVESDIAPDQIPTAAFVAARKAILLIMDLEKKERVKKML